MLDFITKFFRREEASKTLAKERLRLVLMSDRVSLAPEVFDEMKNEMLAVIRRYLEIDERALDMHFENLERQFALLASIPVLKVKTPEQGGFWRNQEHAFAHAAVEGAAAVNGSASMNAVEDTGSGLKPQTRRRRRRRRNPSVPPGNGEVPPSPPAP